MLNLQVKEILKYIFVCGIILSNSLARASFEDDYGFFNIGNNSSYKEYKEVSNYNLNDAVGESKRLIKSGRQNLFIDYFENLLVLAAQDPGIQNLQALTEFIDWGVQEGVISESLSKLIRNEYFHYKFINLTSLTLQDACLQYDNIRKNLTAEMKKKEMGLLNALGQEEKYKQAYNIIYPEIMYTLEDYCN
ncbi:MAG: hypothetical protein KDD58_02820 [Bdellovibrionales bacterium]|nr:hypothetical protein [Bdellovibrionales bacterium]